MRGRLSAAVFAILLSVLYWQVEAGQERYDYDGLGRLIRRVDSQNKATEYTYDSAGNILRVSSGAAVQAPSISSVTPATIRRGETKQLIIVGANLTGVTVSADAADIDIYDVKTATGQMTLMLAVSANATTGTRLLRLSSAAGSANGAVTVAPLLPKVTFEPTPLAIPPDGVARQITLRLSNADVIDHTIALAASSSKITVSPAQLTFAAGQTTAKALVTGVTAGTADILTSSATLGASGVPVYVTADFRGISTSYNKPLGVVLEAPPSSAGKTVSPLASQLVGVAVGNYVSAVSPSAIAVGSSAQINLSGYGLNSAAAVAVIPNAGVTTGSLAASADGRALAIPISVAPDSPLGPRRIVVTDAAGKVFPVTHPNADQISIVRTAPYIESIDPLFATRGTTLTLLVRGRNLHDAQFAVTPNLNLVFGNDPVISADGTEARVKISVGLAAALGDYAVVATTPGGSSSAAASAANTFRVVNEIREAVTPILSLPVGITFGDSTAASKSTAAYARPLGVSVGRVITGVSPAAGIIGTTVTLSLQGIDLQGVTSVQLNPATGITVGPITAAADGKSAAVDLVIAADAPRSGRALKVLAGTAEVPFSDPGAGQFLVTAPLPGIASIAPNAIQRGQAPQTLTISGSNFKDASAIIVLPPDGMIVSPPTVNAEANRIAVTVAADANAAVGPRTIIVVTPAGQSTTVAGAANTLTVGQTVMPGPSPLLSSPLGVVLEGGPPSPTTSFLVSPSLGIVLDTATVPVSPQGLATGSLGVAVGPVTLGIEPDGFAPETTGILTIRGSGLQQVGSVIAEPADGITLSNVVASPDGTTVTANIAVAAGAQPLVPRRVRVSANGAAIPDAAPAGMTFQVGPGVPQFDSISPILGKGGDKLTLTIRGQNLKGATAVTATPPDGIVVSNVLTVDPTGTLLTVELYVSPDAPIGSRVIRAWVPGAASDEVAAPDNTFTVYAP